MEEVMVLVDKRKRCLEEGELIDAKRKVMVNGKAAAGSMIKADADADADSDAVDDVKENKKGAVVDHDHEEEEEEGEVEEFFSILKRIRIAVKYFEKGESGRGRRRGKGEAGETMGRAWKPSFEREDFEGFDNNNNNNNNNNSNKVVKGVEESVEENAVLDLNAHPSNSYPILP